MGLNERLVAHRGFQKHFPENTLLSVQEAVAAGAVNVEVDIQFTRDGQPVLYHDKNLTRVSGKTGNIADMPADEICRLPASEPSRLGECFEQVTITHLRELAAFVTATPGLRIFLEVKEEAIARVGIEEAYQIIYTPLQDCIKQIVPISYNRNFVAHLRQRGWPRVGTVIRCWSDIDDHCSREIKPDYIFVNQRRLPKTGQLPQMSGLLVVYEVGDPGLAVKLFNRGVDMVETFDIGGMITGLASHSI